MFSCELIKILRTRFLQDTFRLETFKENTYIGALFVPVMLRGMPCDFIKVGLYQQHFQKNIWDFDFSGQIFNKKLWGSLSLKQRLFISLVIF